MYRLFVDIRGKNIDNVVPDRLKDETVEWKQIIAGVLVTLQKRAFDYLQLLETGCYNHQQIEEIIRFVQQDLCCRKNNIKELEDAELVMYLKKKLNRPMRVCGVVKNVGEPGGGPFLTYNQDGTVSLQILESSQIDKSNTAYMEMFTKGTHFNPVDLVCAVKDYQDKPFNLPDFVDPTTGFISHALASSASSSRECRNSSSDIGFSTSVSRTPTRITGSLPSPSYDFQISFAPKKAAMQ